MVNTDMCNEWSRGAGCWSVLGTFIVLFEIIPLFHRVSTGRNDG